MDHAKCTGTSGVLVGLVRGGPLEPRSYNRRSVLCTPEGEDPKTCRELLVPTLTLKSLEVVTPVLTMREKLIPLNSNDSS